MNKEVKYCDKHPRRTQKYICFDQNCSNPQKLCILCLKKEHSACKNQLIIELKASTKIIHKYKKESIKPKFD